MAATRKRAPQASRTPRPRHREGTRAALIAAVGELLTSQGASALRVGVIAEHVGVDKALIYRYFGDLDGLISAFASSPEFWMRPDELILDREHLLGLPLPERLSLILERYARALRKRPATVAILAAEMLERTSIHAPLEAAREKFGLEMLSLATDVPEGLDLPAVVTVLTGAVHYLLIRSQHITTFNGVRIGTDRGWMRIEQAIEQLAKAVCRSAQGPPSTGSTDATRWRRR